MRQRILVHPALANATAIAERKAGDAEPGRDCRRQLGRIEIMGIDLRQDYLACAGTVLGDGRNHQMNAPTRTRPMAMS
jgi:hypothetical protein